MRLRRWIGVWLAVLCVACSASKDDYMIGENPTLEVFDEERLLDAGEVVTIAPEYGADGWATTRNITLRNTGNGPLVITRLELVALPEGAFSIGLATLPSEDNPVVIPVAQNGKKSSWTVPIQFVYEAIESVPEGVLTITTNPDTLGKTQHQVKLRCLIPDPQLQASPSILDFGTVSDGSTAKQTLSLLNTGSDTLFLYGLTLEGDAGFQVNSELLLSGEEQADSGLDTPVIIEPGNSHPVEVTFTPQGPQAASGFVRIMSNDPDLPEGFKVSLHANSGGPCIALKPQKVSFGGKLVGKLATMDVQLVSCGDEPLVIHSLALTDDSSDAFDLELGEMAFPLAVPVNASVTVTVSFVPQVLAELDAAGMPSLETGTLRVQSNTYVPQLDAELTGFGVDTECPTPKISVLEGEEVCPQTMLHLVGSQSSSPGGAVSAYQWTVEQPQGSISAFLPSSTLADPTFEANVAGVYTFKLHVKDEAGGGSGTPLCPDAQVKVVVVPCEAIHIELLWDTPSDADQSDEGPEAGADLDLHFLHPFAQGQDVDGDGVKDGWFDIPFDTYWFNDQPNWASMDGAVDDDPGLDRDDTNGAGPENINLNEPEDGAVYRVGVHYWDDHGYGPSTATVRIYIHSVLAFEMTGVELINCDLWDVASIHWPSGTITPTAAPSDKQVVHSFCGPNGWN